MQRLEKDDNEKDLNQEIVRQMREGKSDKEILDNLFGNASKPKKRPQETTPKKSVDDLLDDFLEMEPSSQKSDKKSKLA